jgi:hypothetical protein
VQDLEGDGFRRPALPIADARRRSGWRRLRWRRSRKQRQTLRCDERYLWRRSLGRIYRERVPTIHDPIMTPVTIHDLIRLRLENLAAKLPKVKIAKGSRVPARREAGFRRTIHAYVVRPRPSPRLASPRHATPRHATPRQARRGEARRARACVFPYSSQPHTCKWLWNIQLFKLVSLHSN